MKLTEFEIQQAKWFGFSSYADLYIEKYRVQLLIRESDKLHGFFEIEIRKMNKKFTNFKSSFFRYGSQKQLLEILNNY